MWHASAAPIPGDWAIRDVCELWAHDALDHVGDPAAEWRAWSGKAFHIKRRLTESEQTLTGPAIDIRNDLVEVERRIRPYRHRLPKDYRE